MSSRRWSCRVVRAALRDPERLAVAALVEPFGMAAWSQATRYFTAADANTQMPAFAGALLHNRLIWLTAAIAILAIPLAPAPQPGSPWR